MMAANPMAQECAVSVFAGSLARKQEEPSAPFLDLGLVAFVGYSARRLICCARPTSQASADAAVCDVGETGVAYPVWR